MDVWWCCVCMCCIGWIGRRGRRTRWVERRGLLRWVCIWIKWWEFIGNWNRLWWLDVCIWCLCVGWWERVRNLLIRRSGLRTTVGIILRRCCGRWFYCIRRSVIKMCWCGINVYFVCFFLCLYWCVWGLGCVNISWAILRRRSLRLRACLSWMSVMLKLCLVWCCVNWVCMIFVVSNIWIL